MMPCIYRPHRNIRVQCVVNGAAGDYTICYVVILYAEGQLCIQYVLFQNVPWDDRTGRAICLMKYVVLNTGHGGWTASSFHSTK